MNMKKFIIMCILLVTAIVSASACELNFLCTEDSGEA